MKKIIVSVFSLIIIISSLFFIEKLLEEPRDDGEITTTTVSFGEYDLFDYGEVYSAYVINDTSYFEYLLYGFDIKYRDNVLEINDEVIDAIDVVYKYFAIYDASILVMGYRKNDVDYVLTYNYKLKDKYEYSIYKDMLVDLEQDLIFEDAGFIINFTNVKNNKYVKNDKDICSIKNDDKIKASLAVEYYYSVSDKKFTKSEELYSVNLFVYKRDNNLCK